MPEHPVDEVALLCDAIRALLDTPAESRGLSLAGLEDTLTEGYARALALEAERLRLERRIGELGGRLRSGEEGSAAELTTLASRLSHATSRLSRLRALLAGLRERIDVVRARGAYATIENARP